MFSFARKLWTPPKRFWLPPRDRRGAFRFSPGCCCGGGDCEACLNGNRPDAMIVDLSGISNAACTDCTGINGTWTIDFVSCLFIPGGPQGDRYNLRYESDFLATPMCANIVPGRYLRIRVTVGWNPDVPQRDITVFATFVLDGASEGTATVNYEIIESAAEQFDCMNFDDFDVPPNGGESLCEFDPGSTCLVSAA